jgi:hypothetical protein
LAFPIALCFICFATSPTCVQLTVCQHFL